MSGARTPPAFWLQLLQALVAREAVEQVGLSGRSTASLLGLAPSAVSQYLSGKRVGSRFARFSTDDGARQIARTTIERLRTRVDEDHDRTTVLLEAASTLARHFESPARAAVARRAAFGTTGGQPTPARELVNWLRHRVRAEQAAVSQSMKLAQKARDELTRGLLRQIASDSLRHAEIVASLATYLDRGVSASFASGITPDEVRALIEGERRAETQADLQIGGHLRGTMSLLVRSMEADERKHAELLQGLLTSGFASPDAAAIVPAGHDRRANHQSMGRRRRAKS